MSRRDGVYFYLPGWCSLSYRPNYTLTYSLHHVPMRRCLLLLTRLVLNSLNILTTYSLHHVPMRHQLLLLTRLLITHSPFYLLTYLLTSSGPNEVSSTSTYEAGTYLLTYLRTYLPTIQVGGYRAPESAGPTLVVLLPPTP